MHKRICGYDNQKNYQCADGSGDAEYLHGCHGAGGGDCLYRRFL